MTEIFGVPVQALFGQLMLGLVNGSFYAVLSLGLAVIFGMPGWWCDGGMGALVTRLVVAPCLACTTVGETGFVTTAAGFTATARFALADDAGSAALTTGLVRWAKARFWSAGRAR